MVLKDINVKDKNHTSHLATVQQLMVIGKILQSASDLAAMLRGNSSVISRTIMRKHPEKITKYARKYRISSKNLHDIDKFIGKTINMQWGDDIHLLKDTGGSSSYLQKATDVIMGDNVTNIGKAPHQSMDTFTMTDEGMGNVLEKEKEAVGNSFAMGSNDFYVFRDFSRNKLNSYSRFLIKKKTKKALRLITAPNYHLKTLQRKMNDLLATAHDNNPDVLSYKKGVDYVKELADKNLQYDNMLSIDLKDFFMNIDDDKVMLSMSKALYKLSRKRYQLKGFSAKGELFDVSELGKTYVTMAKDLWKLSEKTVRNEEKVNPIIKALLDTIRFNAVVVRLYFGLLEVHKSAQKKFIDSLLSYSMNTEGTSVLLIQTSPGGTISTRRVSGSLFGKKSFINPIKKLSIEELLNLSSDTGKTELPKDNDLLLPIQTDKFPKIHVKLRRDWGTTFIPHIDNTLPLIMSSTIIQIMSENKQSFLTSAKHRGSSSRTSKREACALLFPIYNGSDTSEKIITMFSDFYHSSKLEFSTRRALRSTETATAFSTSKTTPLQVLSMLSTRMKNLMMTPSPINYNDVADNIEAKEVFKNKLGVISKKRMTALKAILSSRREKRQGGWEWDILKHPKMIWKRGIPQGAPTSGAIATLMGDMIHTVLKERVSLPWISDVHILVYSDNLYIFFNHKDNFRGTADTAAQELSLVCNSALKELGLPPNRKKETLMTGENKKILGILIDKRGNLRTSRRIRREVNQIIINLNKRMEVVYKGRRYSRDNTQRLEGLLQWLQRPENKEVNRSVIPIEWDDNLRERYCS